MTMDFRIRLREILAELEDLEWSDALTRAEFIRLAGEAVTIIEENDRPDLLEMIYPFALDPEWLPAIGLDA